MASCRGCLRYDAAWSLILALDAALTAGGDINDGSVVLDALKAVSFEGTQNQSTYKQFVDYLRRRVRNGLL